MNDKKVVLITGAASGIGKETAIEFSRNSVSVVIADISEKGEETRDIIIKNGGSASYFKCDVTKYSDHQTLINNIIKEYGQLDYAFNNAGIEQKPEKIADVSEETWDKLININLKGVWLGMKSQIPFMIKHGGVIINTASVAALKAVEEIGIYNATKSAVVMMSRTAAKEYAKNNIRVNAICPGLIMTEMAIRMSEEHPTYFKEKMLDVIPMGRGGQPEEIAKMVFWLCKSATFITGQCITADGGWLA